jgi:uncharacterized protein YukE
MTLNDLLGSVVNQLQNDEQNLNQADPEHPTHGSDLLARFRTAQEAASSDPDADLGQVFGQVSSAMSSTSNGFTSQAYGSAFDQGVQAFAGRNNQLNLQDLAPIIGMIANGFMKHDTRGVGNAGPLGALGPLLGMLGGGQQQQQQGGGLDLGSIAGALLGGGGGAGGLGGLLGGLLGGGQPQQQQQQPNLGGMLGGAGGGNPLEAMLGAIQQGSQMTHANGQRDAGATSTGSVLTGLLGALMNQRR